jgi:hypothetical protein
MKACVSVTKSNFSPILTIHTGEKREEIYPEKTWPAKTIGNSVKDGSFPGSLSIPFLTGETGETGES